MQGGNSYFVGLAEDRLNQGVEFRAGSQNGMERGEVRTEG